MKKLLSIGPLFIVIASFLWSLDGLLRRSLYVLPPIIIVFYEHLLGFIILAPFLLTSLKSVKTIKPKAWGALLWVTLLSSIAGTLFYTAALGQVNYIQFSVVVLLQKLQPVFAIITAAFVLKEKITREFIIWFVVAMTAAYLVSFPSLVVNWQTGRGTIIAALLAVAAAFCWATSTAFSRYLLLRLSTLVTTALRFGLASLLGLGFVFALGQQQTLTALTLGQWLALLTITFSTGMVALFIYYYGLKKTPVRITTICELTWPMSAVFIDYFYFHQGLNATQLLGAAILLVAIYRVSIMARHHDNQPTT